MYDYFLYLVFFAVGGLFGYVARARVGQSRRGSSEWSSRSEVPGHGGGSYVTQQDPVPPKWATKQRGAAHLSPDLIRDVESLSTRLDNVEGRVRRLEDANANRRDEETRPGGGRSREPDRRGRADAERADKSNTQRSTGRTADTYAVQDSYFKMSEGVRDLPIQPLYVTLDSDGTAGAIGETVRRFRQSESKHQVFVVFQKSTGEGWLYPNPRHPYNESMRYVFPWLTHANYEEAKLTIDPLPARLVGEGLWEALPG